MAGSLNKVLLIGRLGNDPEIKQMQNGKSVARLSVATSESWKDKNTGEKKEKTEWHRVVIFNEGLVSVVQKYLKKGAQVYIEGQLNTNREQYVFSCLIDAVQEVIESSLKKASDPEIKLELTKLHVELTQFQTASSLQITNSLFQRDYQITV